VSLRRQDRYLQEAAYLVWKLPRVRSLNQFRAVDGKIEPEDGSKSGASARKSAFRQFQSGLLFSNMAPKPAGYTFPHPFVITDQAPRRGESVVFWGQARPGERHWVTIEFSSDSDGPFSQVVRLASDNRGYFSTRLRPQSGYYRYRYDAPQDNYSGVPLGTSQVLSVRVR
jgi:hypothetical protein